MLWQLEHKCWQAEQASHTETEYHELEEIHKDHWIQLLALHRAVPPCAWESSVCLYYVEMSECTHSVTTAHRWKEGKIDFLPNSYKTPSKNPNSRFPLSHAAAFWPTSINPGWISFLGSLPRKDPAPPSCITTINTQQMHLYPNHEQPDSSAEEHLPLPELLEDCGIRMEQMF